MSVVVIEWCCAPWEDVAPRLSAAQLPCLARLAGAGAVGSISTAAAPLWDAGVVVEHLRGAGVAAKAVGWGHRSTETQRITADEIDPRISRLFPGWPPARIQIANALAELYTRHNAAIQALDEVDARGVIAVRHDFIDEVSRCYCDSPKLAEARAVAFTLSDLLLNDLRQEAGLKCRVIVLGRGAGSRPGFCVIPRATAAAARGTAANASLASVLRDLAGSDARFTAALPGEEFAPVENWRRPMVAPVRVTKPGWISGDVHVRLRRGDDAARLAMLFPRIAWPAGGAGFLMFAGGGEQTLLGAAVVDDRGAVTFDVLAGAEAGAEVLLQTVVDEARRRGLSRLTNGNDIPVGDVRLRVMEAVGFSVTGTVRFWRAELKEAIERVGALREKPVDGQLRPPTAEDVARWRGRDVAEGLIRERMAFDPDLSFVLDRQGVPAGLLLVRRVEKVGCIELLVTSPEARRSGALLALVRAGMRSALVGGLRTVIFTTDDTRREAVAVARGCGAREVQTSIRLACDLGLAEPKFRTKDLP